MFAGGYARVCLCLHEPSAQYFALKMLSSEGVARPKQMEHVQCEMDILQVVNSVDVFFIIVPNYRKSATHSLFPS